MTTGEFADIYVLVKTRSSQLVYSFLNKFLSQRMELADEYEIPQYQFENPEIVFKKADDLILYCENHEQTAHTLYYKNAAENREPSVAMIFYTDDAHTIFGLSVHAGTVETEYLNHMKNFLKSDSGFIMNENPAPNNSLEFRELLRKHLI